MNSDNTTDRVVELIKLLAEVPGPSNAEQPRLEALSNWLSAHNVDHSSDSVGNIHVQLGSGKWGDTLVLDAHVDVVDCGVCENVETDGNKLCGLGVGDDLAAVALLAVFAADSIASGRKFDRPVRIIFTVGEEGLGNLRGVRQVVLDNDKTNGAPGMYVAVDGYMTSLRTSGIGSTRYSMSVHGPGGHSWGAFGTPSATHFLVELLGQVSRRYADVAAGSDLSYNIGIITGGEGINSISRSAVVSFEFRSSDSDLLTAMHEKLAELINGCNKPDSLELELNIIGLRPAAFACGNDKYAEQLRDIWATEGLKLIENPASTNINLPLAAGWPAVCVGLCLGSNCHRLDEYILIDSLTVGHRLLEKIVDAHLPE